jgi:transaldolase
MACDIFRSVYEETQGADGFVSLEVNPHLGRDTQGTLEEVRRLFRQVDRPNVFIKIPGTKEGLEAIEKALSEGININITLIFSLRRYGEVMQAWLRGLERRAKEGKAIDRVASVASFFVSRVDTLVDSQLEKKMIQASAAERKNLDSLFGKAAIANARLAYDLFLKLLTKPEFKFLEAKGARVQRPLWASTSTKNPRYRDVMYVEEMIGKETVDTMPLQTIEAFRDHGKVRQSLPGDIQEATQTLERLAQAGIDMAHVGQQLEDEGLKLFSESYDSLLKSIEHKREALKVLPGR